MWRKNITLIDIGLGLLPLLAIVAFSLVFYYRANRQLADLDQLNGVVKSAQVIQGGGKTEPYYAVLTTVEQPQIPVGIYMGQDDVAANNLVARIHPGDQALVYYDASGAIAEQGINLHVYQLEVNGAVLYGIDSEKDGNLRMASAFAFIGALCFMFLLLANARRRKQLVTSAR
ncbi:hypothetical protein F0P96_03700 [Hymenobacter busanensis]|uniref:Uncharacterized protein n=1 Tax=Hymenobacter busanensis TaxID=2607656 RepID=A0A7L4ZUL7_9BACT|nr:hypothetical protein [Hymenobacter busanensis]KAA9339731.1 hypothetical protein F0P96_03700 [Hymenobacter busanensis]QHJ06515.1 hypothetical protein GUY19_04050 [Hymenobacter busanensis]